MLKPKKCLSPKLRKELQAIADGKFSGSPSEMLGKLTEAVKSISAAVEDIGNRTTRIISAVRGMK